MIPWKWSVLKRCAINTTHLLHSYIELSFFPLPPCAWWIQNQIDKTQSTKNYVVLMINNRYQKTFLETIFWKQFDGNFLGMCASFQFTIVGYSKLFNMVYQLTLAWLKPFILKLHVILMTTHWLLWWIGLEKKQTKKEVVLEAFFFLFILFVLSHVLFEQLCVTLFNKYSTGTWKCSVQFYNVYVYIPRCKVKNIDGWSFVVVHVMYMFQRSHLLSILSDPPFFLQREGTQVHVGGL